MPAPSLETKTLHSIELLLASLDASNKDTKGLICLHILTKSVCLNQRKPVEDHAFAPARLPDQGEAKPIEE